MPKTTLKKHHVNCEKVDTAILKFKPTPTSMQQLGNALVEIALGNEPMPATPAATAKLLKSLGVVIPEGITVEMRRRDPKHMIIMIPPKALVEASICEAREYDKEGYNNYLAKRLPDYQAVLDGSWYASGKSNEDFYDVRVADYTMSYCR
jgi:hypothetical protein